MCFKQIGIAPKPRVSVRNMRFVLELQSCKLTAIVNPNNPYSHSMKKSFFFLIVILLLGIIVAGVCFTGLKNRDQIAYLSEISGRYGLTGLCLSIESRHTRHLLFAGEMAAFQDIPGWMDHFPSSTFIFPPRQVQQQAKASE